MHVISVHIFPPSEFLSSSPQVCFVCHALIAHMFLEHCVLVNYHVCVLTSVGSAVAQGLTEQVQGTSAFLFGWADVPLERGLAQRRKEMGWFKKIPDLQAIRPDVGPQPQKRFGLTGT